MTPERISRALAAAAFLVHAAPRGAMVLIEGIAPILAEGFRRLAV